MARARSRVVIAGAAGRDFHDFNVCYRADASVEVVAFTAAQIPGIEGRRYPPGLAGPLYPEGIPIVPEEALERLAPDRVVFAYSDVRHEQVMHLASRALACGADFELIGPRRSQLAAGRPVLAVSAVRTGCGKSPLARWISRRLRALGLRVAVLRHPMPYGDLDRQAVQRFASLADLDQAGCTIEEREEYEPHIEAGGVVHAGVDYERVLAQAVPQADVILWDGGNNDFPFVRPDLHIVLADALRPADGLGYHPGEACLRMADVVVVSKSDRDPEGAREAARLAAQANPRAGVLLARLVLRVEEPESLRGSRVAVVEDGPTLTHGGMAYGAGLVAAREAGAVAVDPRPWAAPGLAEVFRQHPHIGPVVPAMGYSPAQRAALAATLEAMPGEAVLAATPVDLARLLALRKPVRRVRYEFADDARGGLGERLDAWLTSVNLAPTRGRTVKR